MYNKRVRINAVEVIVNSDLSVSYRLTLPVKLDHSHLLDQKLVNYYPNKKRTKMLAMFVYESNDRNAIIQAQTAAQIVINDQKISELQEKAELLLSRLSTTQKQ